MFWIATLFCAFGIFIKLSDDYFDIADDSRRGGSWALLSAGVFLLIALVSPVGFVIAVAETVACFCTGKVDRPAYWSGPVALFLGAIVGGLFFWDRSLLSAELLFALPVIFLGGCLVQIANNKKRDFSCYGLVPALSRYGTTTSVCVAAVLTLIPFDAVIYAFVYETAYGTTKFVFRSYLGYPCFSEKAQCIAK